MKTTELTAIINNAPVDSCDDDVVHLVLDHLALHHVVYAPNGTLIDEAGQALLRLALDWAADRCQEGQAS